MLYPYLYINGEIRPKENANIPVYDLGLLRGHGVFDFFRVLEGIPVFAEDHIARLQHSLELVHLHVDLTASDWLALFYEMIRRNDAERAGYRIVVTGGFSEDGYTLPDRPNVYMMLHDIPQNNPAEWQKGVYLLESEYQRDIPEAKTTIYVQSMQLQPMIKKEGAFDVLYSKNGFVRECSRCNVFFIDQQDVIHTPSDSMLRGITRKKVIAGALEKGIRIVERDFRRDEIPDMAGAFLTASTKGVLPITRLGNQIIGHGEVHPLCGKLQSIFEEKVENYIASARLAHAVL